MSTARLPSLLKYLIDSGFYRLTDLAKKTNLHSSDLSKTINGHRVCSGRMLESILKGLDEKHHAQVLVAWLLDQIPAGFEGLVHIVKDSSSFVREEIPDVRTMEGSLKVLAAQADANPAVRKLVMTMAAAFNK